MRTSPDSLALADVLFGHDGYVEAFALPIQLACESAFFFTLTGDMASATASFATDIA